MIMHHAHFNDYAAVVGTNTSISRRRLRHGLQHLAHPTAVLLLCPALPDSFARIHDMVLMPRLSCFFGRSSRTNDSTLAV